MSVPFSMSLIMQVESRMKQSSGTIGICLVLVLLLNGNQLSQAQLQIPKSSKPKGAPIKTSISVMLLMQNAGSSLAAQEWGRIFRDLNVSVQTRRSSVDDKPDIEENVRGTFRQVRLVGVLDRKGEIQFPGHRFARKDLGKLKEWLNELKTYGAQGSPDSKPLWGLSADQFKVVFAELSQPAPVNVEGLPLKEAISKLDFPDTLRIRFTVAAEKLLSEKFKDEKIVTDLDKLAKGTVLAIALKQYELAFYPSRTPSAALELVIAPWDETPNSWPIGWELKESRQKTAPRYFQLIPVELNEVPLRDVLMAASKASGIPMILDEYAIRKQQIDPDKISVTYPKRRTTWGILIRNAIGKHRLTRKLVIDEQGKPFIWITVFSPRAIPQTRR